MRPVASAEMTISAGTSAASSSSSGAWFEARRSAAARAFGRAAHDEAREAGAAELLGHQLAHFGRADQQRGAAVEIAVDAAREIERRRRDRLRPLGDRRLAPHPPRAGEGGDEHALERRADEPHVARHAMGGAELPQHMRLADDGAVERARDGEKMTQRRLALEALQRGGDGLGAQRGARRDRRRENFRGARIVGDELHAVAGRDQHRLAEPGLAQRLERAVEIVLDHRETLPQLGRRRAMMAGRR